MERRHKILLAIDGIINLLIGIVLMLFPAGIMKILGLPAANTFFYATILGAVIFGIGVALFVELFGASVQARGLGLGGAIAINICGGGALIVWLVAVPLEIPLRGQIILWVVAILVLGIGAIEIAAKSWRYSN